MIQVLWFILNQTMPRSPTLVNVQIIAHGESFMTDSDSQKLNLPTHVEIRL